MHREFASRTCLVCSGRGRSIAYCEVGKQEVAKQSLVEVYEEVSAW